MFFSMSSAHERKKDPLQVRRNLMDCAARISVEQGLTSVTIQAVAAAAGVTKGGLLHHFPGKRELIEAVFNDLLEKFDEWIDSLLADDPIEYGRFTRAYANTVLLPAPKGQTVSWNALSVSMITDPDLRTLWHDWYTTRMKQHKHTDSDPVLQLIRYAADGIWLADGIGANSPKNRKELRALITAMTHQTKHS
jgi:AcrR family transcriptional regulator